MKRVIERTKPKEAIFKTLVQDFFLENPNAEKAIIEIREDKDSRSTKQNSLYWDWLTVISETGHTKDELHIIFRDKFLGYNEVTTKTKTVKELRSTTSLKVGEMKDYLEQIDIFAAEYGLILPRPEDLYVESMGYKRG